jgi:multidrug efflux pump subunit AcrB
MKLFGFFIQRPMIVNLLMALILVAGINMIRTSAIQGAPTVEFGIFTITTIRAGASAEKMELSVTVPVEEELLEVENVKRVISNSMEGLSIIQVDADSKATPEQLDQIEADLQKAIDRAVNRLPKDILEKPALIAMNGSHRSLLSLMISGTASEEVQRKIVRNLESRLREVRGVASVDRFGYRDREVRVMLDPEKMSRLALSYDEVTNAIRSRNVTETGGSLESFVGEQDVLAIGEFEQPKDVADVIVRSSGPGDYLRLRDIAEIVMDYEDWQDRYFMRGEPGIFLQVRAESEINEFKVVAAIEEVLAEMRAGIPSNVHIEVVGDGSEVTRSILSSLLNNAAIGGVLIAFALLVFFPWRSMFWVVAGLPIAVLAGLVLMQIIGLPLTATSMVAIILMLGLLVDDAIVASESIYRKYEQGLSPKEAALQGISAVSQPVITGAITTILAMMPLLLVGGIDAKFLWIIPATVILMVLGSLFECMFLLPSHIADSLERAGRQAERAHWFDSIEASYRSLLQFYLSRPLWSLLILLGALFLALLYLSQASKFEPYPDVDGDKLLLVAELPIGSTHEDTRRVLRQVEQELLQQPLAKYVQQSYITVGKHDTEKLHYLIEGQQQNWGKIVFRLTPFNSRRTTVLEVEKAFREVIQDDERFSHIDLIPVADQPPSGNPVELQVILDSDERSVIAEEILNFLRDDDRVTQVWSNYLPGKSIVELMPRHEKLSDYGLRVADLTQALQVAYDGILVEELQTREELVRFRLQLQDRYRRDINALRSLNIVTPSGESVPLRNVADFEIRQGQMSIAHYAGLRTETIFAEIDRDRASPLQINQALRDFIAERAYQQQYPGLRFYFGGEVDSQAETAEAMSGGLILVVTSIFFVMVLLFNSLSLPIVTLMLVPVSFIWVLFVFGISGLNVGVAAMVGLLGLVGVLVNGALVMIDQIRKLHISHGDGGNRLATRHIVEGAVMRLRPLLITALTTIVGLGPAAYGIAGTQPSTEALLLVMFWGVAVGAVVTLFTLPLFLRLDSLLKEKIAQLRS